MANIADMEKAYHRVKLVFVLKVMEIFYFWDQAMYSLFFDSHQWLSTRQDLSSSGNLSGRSVIAFSFHPLF